MGRGSPPRLSTEPKYSKKLCKSLGLSFDTCVAVDTAPISKENISTAPQNTTSNIGLPSSQDINNVRDTESSKIELEGYQCQSADCVKLCKLCQAGIDEKHFEKKTLGYKVEQLEKEKEV